MCWTSKITEFSIKCSDGRIIMPSNCFRTSNHRWGQLSPPTDTECHTISISDTAINSSEPNQQPKSRSAETHAVPFKPFFWKRHQARPAIQRLSFPFLYRTKLRTPISFRRVGTDTDPKEVTSTMWSWDNGTGPGDVRSFSEAFVRAMTLKICCNIPSCVGVSFL